MARSTLVGYPGSCRDVHGCAGVLPSRYPRLVNRMRLSSNPLLGLPALGRHSMRTVVVGSSK